MWEQKLITIDVKRCKFVTNRIKLSECFCVDFTSCCLVEWSFLSGRSIMFIAVRINVWWSRSHGVRTGRIAYGINWMESMKWLIIRKYIRDMAFDDFTGKHHVHRWINSSQRRQWLSDIVLLSLVWKSHRLKIVKTKVMRCAQNVSAELNYSDWVKFAMATGLTCVM